MSPGRLALSKRETAEALGVSVDFLEEHVMHELRVVRRGRRRLIPVRELERWLEESACALSRRIGTWGDDHHRDPGGAPPCTPSDASGGDTTYRCTMGAALITFLYGTT